MELQPFIEDIRARAGLLTQEEAIGAAEATLETLGEVLENDTRTDIARDLPDSLASALRRSQAGQHLAHDEFYERVTEREKQGRGLAMEHAQAVCQALAQALNSEQRSKLRGMVPEDYRYLFEPPSTVDMSAEAKETGDVARKGDRKQGMAQPDPSAGPINLEDTEATRKSKSLEPSPSPEESSQSSKNRDHRNKN